MARADGCDHVEDFRGSHVSWPPPSSARRPSATSRRRRPGLAASRPSRTCQRRHGPPSARRRTRSARASRPRARSSRPRPGGSTSRAARRWARTSSSGPWREPSRARDSSGAGAAPPVGERPAYPGGLPGGARAARIGVMTAPRMRAVALAALVCGAAVIALLAASDHQGAKTVWAVFGPVVGWNFIGVGLYAWRRRPESATGRLMVLLGFAWFLSALAFANSRALYSVAFVIGGLWGGVFLHLVMAFPSGRLAPGRDRALVIAGYLIFTLASIPEMLFAGPHELGCDRCPTNVLLIRRDADLANLAIGFQVALYVALFVIVLVRLVMRWRRTGQLERLQLTPVYVFGLLTFLLATASLAGAGDAAGWATFTATALLPFAFLVGLLRSHVARLDADLRARVVELRASRARLVEAGDTERRRLERNLHDGAQ